MKHVYYSDLLASSLLLVRDLRLTTEDELVSASGCSSISSTKFDGKTPTFLGKCYSSI